MDALKWIVKISFALALLFMGVKTQPKAEPDKKDQNTGIAVGYVYFR